MAASVHLTGTAQTDAGLKGIHPWLTVAGRRSGQERSSAPIALGGSGRLVRLDVGRTTGASTPSAQPDTTGDHSV
jgi:hypothetical protein